MSGPIHLQPTAPLAPRVLLPGDPARALLLAQALLEEPKMFNHSRGLWGYSGQARDGEPLTIQSTGMGGPSAAIVISELADLGAQRLLRVGTCGALAPGLELGMLLAVELAIPEDGTSRSLEASDRTYGDPALTTALTEASEATPIAVVCTDLFYGTTPQDEQRWAAAGAGAVDMETATLFSLASQLGLSAGSLLLVSDLLFPQRVRIDPDGLKEAELRMGEAALAALTRLASGPAARVTGGPAA